MFKKNLLLFLIIIAYNIHAQSDKSELTIESVSKKWEFSDLINPKFTKKQYEESKEMLESTFIEFRTDKTFIFSFIIDLEGT